MDSNFRNELAQWLFGFFSAMLGFAILPAIIRVITRKVIGRVLAEVVAILVMGMASGRLSRFAARALKN